MNLDSNELRSGANRDNELKLFKASFQNFELVKIFWSRKLIERDGTRGSPRSSLPFNCFQLVDTPILKLV